MRLLIRADGDGAIGGGHVMRGLALAEQARAAGGSACLASISLSPALLDRAALCGVNLARPSTEIGTGTEADAQWLTATAAELGADWVVTDGYRFGTDYQRAVHACGIRQLVIDDYGHSEHYCAELVLNQNLSASEEMYAHRLPHTRLLLGPEHALLRGEFTVATARDPQVPAHATKLLVTMGAADPDNMTARVLEALASVEIPELRVRILIGPSNPHASRLRGMVPDQRIELVDATNEMAELMAWADMAVSAAGSTTYELCCMRVPCLLTVLADNQRGVAASLAEAGAAVNLGWHDDVPAQELANAIEALSSNRPIRQTLAQNGRALVDGGGGQRVLRAMASFPSTMTPPR